MNALLLGKVLSLAAPIMGGFGAPTLYDIPQGYSSEGYIDYYFECPSSYFGYIVAPNRTTVKKEEARADIASFDNPSGTFTHTVHLTGDSDGGFSYYFYDYLDLHSAANEYSLTPKFALDGVEFTPQIETILPFTYQNDYFLSPFTVFENSDLNNFEQNLLALNSNKTIYHYNFDLQSSGYQIEIEMDSSLNFVMSNEHISWGSPRSILVLTQGRKEHVEFYSLSPSYSLFARSGVTYTVSNEEKEELTVSEMVSLLADNLGVNAENYRTYLAGRGFDYPIMVEDIPDVTEKLHYLDHDHIFMRKARFFVPSMEKDRVLTITRDGEFGCHLYRYYSNNTVEEYVASFHASQFCGIDDQKRTNATLTVSVQEENEKLTLRGLEKEDGVYRSYGADHKAVIAPPEVVSPSSPSVNSYPPVLSLLLSLMMPPYGIALLIQGITVGDGNMILGAGVGILFSILIFVGVFITIRLKKKKPKI